VTVDDEPLFIIAPTPPARVSVRSNRVGLRLAALTAAAGLAVGLAIGTAMNHHRGTPAPAVTASVSR